MASYIKSIQIDTISGNTHEINRETILPIEPYSEGKSFVLDPGKDVNKTIKTPGYVHTWGLSGNGGVGLTIQFKTYWKENDAYYKDTHGYDMRTHWNKIYHPFVIGEKEEGWIYDVKITDEGLGFRDGTNPNWRKQGIRKKKL